MTRVIAIGVGCRKGCKADAIEAVARQALADVRGEPVGVFTLADKRDEAGLAEAARRLGLGLTFLPRDALHEREGEVLTRSEAAARAFGVASVAEAAALAGAGPGSVLIVPRIAADGATCAVAETRP